MGENGAYRRKTCQQKTAAGGAFDMYSHAAALARDMRESGKAVRPYRCSVCCKWHVGRGGLTSAATKIDTILKRDREKRGLRS